MKNFNPNIKIDDLSASVLEKQARTAQLFTLLRQAYLDYYAALEGQPGRDLIFKDAISSDLNDFKSLLVIETLGIDDEEE